MIYVLERPSHSMILHQYHGKPAVGHFGLYKTLHLVGWVFWWAQICHDMETYVVLCPEFGQAKNTQRPPPGLLYLLPMPEMPWGSVSMDFIINLLKSLEAMTLLLVDMFTKMAYFMLCMGLPTAWEMA